MYKKCFFYCRVKLRQKMYKIIHFGFKKWYLQSHLLLNKNASKNIFYSRYQMIKTIWDINEPKILAQEYEIESFSLWRNWNWTFILGELYLNVETLKFYQELADLMIQGVCRELHWAGYYHLRNHRLSTSYKNWKQKFDNSDQNVSKKLIATHLMVFEIHSLKLGNQFLNGTPLQTIETTT